MSKLDDILKPIFDSAEDGNKFWHGETDKYYKQEIKALMLELIGEDEDLTPLAPLPNIQKTAFGRNIEKSSMRRKVSEL